MIYSQRGDRELYKRIPLRSLVRQFVDLQQIRYSNTAGTVRDILNTLRTLQPNALSRVDAGATVSGYGIRVGTGTTPVTISDYNIQTSIGHGNGAGQLYHQATIIGAAQVIGTEAFFTISRNFNNNSGGTITVQEAALLFSDTSYVYLAVRDLTGAIDVLNTKTLAAQYIFKVTV